MKILLSILAVFLAVVVAAERPSISLSPLPWTAYADVESQPYLAVGTKKDLLVHLDGNGPYFTNIRRRNNAGEYISVANITETTSDLATNGKWVVLYGKGNFLFSVDANNEVSESSYIRTVGGNILSDNTFVGLDPTESESQTYTIRTYAYNAANNNWTSIAGTELEVTTQGLSFGGFGTYRASDTHLTFVDYTDDSNVTIKLYERLADKSWSLTDTILLPEFTFGQSFGVLYNDVDTIVLSNAVNVDESVGLVTTFTKMNGQWVEQTFTTESVGYRPSGYLGYRAAFLDANTLLLTAVLEGASIGQIFTEAGKVLMLTRNSTGHWEPALDLVGGNIFGLGVETNDYDVVVASVAYPAGTVTYYVLPRCFYEPINVTCHDQQVNDCSDVTSAELYTINNPQCGAITTTFKGLSLVDNQAVEAQFTFSRAYAEDYSCDATVTCPAPPVAPVTPTKNNTSGVSALQLGFSLVIIVAAVLLA